jgi:CHAT domain-containing protein/Tfp pilus assembly protein PilF
MHHFPATGFAMKITVKLIFVLLGFAGHTWSQGRPADMAALHSEAENAYTARQLVKASETAKSLFEAATLSNDRAEMAFAELIKGQVYNAEGDYGGALEALGHSLELYKTGSDENGEAKVLIQLAVAHRYTAQSGKAFELLKQASDIFEKHQDKGGLALCNLELGNTYTSIDNFRNALEVLQRALQLAEEADQPRVMASVTSALGNVYYQQGNRELALEFYQRSLQIKEKVSNYYEIITTLVNMSATYISLRRLPDAHRVLDRALELSRPEDPRSRAQVLNRYGRVLISENKYDVALARLQETLQLLSGGKDEGLRADTLIRIGQIQASTDQFEEAFQTASNALAIADSLQTGILRVMALEVRGVAAMGLHRDEEALSTFMKLIEVHEELRANVAGDAVQVQALLRTEGDEMHGAVDLLVRLKRPEEAFQVSERNKGAALLTVLGAEDAQLTKHLTPVERDKETRLQRNVVDANVALAQANRTSVRRDRIHELETIVQKARLDLDMFETTLYAAHPELQVHRNQAAAVSVEEAAKILPDSRTVFLEYEVGPSHCYVFTLSRNADGRPVFHVHELGTKPEDLVAQVNAFRAKIAERDLGFRDDARKLYQMLIEPAAADLAGKDTLVITPDSILWQLPFQALSINSNQFLIEKYAVFFAPSITVLSRIKHPEYDARQPVLFAAGDATVGHELPALKSIYGPDSRVITGTSVTENAVKAAGSQYRVVHLAAHGFYDDQHPMNSYLQFDRPGDDSEDGKLEAREMMSMDLKADLVVLSACETARGDSRGGEGMVGMTWALLVAGVPTTVASEWKVDAGSTAELMVRFHRLLKQSSFTNKAKALQQAALAVMKDSQYRHPFYWAGFVMVGAGF